MYEVVDSNESATSEAVLSLKSGADNLNITLQDLATQVRQAFYGEEVQRIPRGRDTGKSDGKVARKRQGILCHTQ